MNWITEPSGVSSDLLGVSCSDAETCMAVGAGGTALRRTSNQSWASPPRHLPPPIADLLAPTADLLDVDCPMASVCVVVGAPDGLTGLSTVLRWIETVGWTPGVAPSTAYLSDVDCTGATAAVATGTCYAVGTAATVGTVLASRDLGGTWTPQAAETVLDITGVSCTVTDDCIAVDNAGFILSKASASTAWTRVIDRDPLPSVPSVPSTSVPPNPLYYSAVDSFQSASCAMSDDVTTYCVAVGLRDLKEWTADGTLKVANWSTETPSGHLDSSTNDLYGVSCTPTTCLAVGEGGTRLRR